MIQPDYTVKFEYQGKNYVLDITQVEDKTIHIIRSSENSPFLTSFESLSDQTLEDLQVFLEESGASSIEVASKIDNIRAKTIDYRHIEEKLQSIYKKFEKNIVRYCESGQVGKGALMVQVIGIEGSGPIIYGQLSADNPQQPTEHTIGRTGSGAKLWTALLSKVIAKKYPDYFKMSDGMGKFAPEETLRKFSDLDLGDVFYSGEELAKEISIESLLSMTTGLEYEDKGPKEEDEVGRDLSLDQLLRNPDVIKDKSIHFIGHPRDKVYWYTNNIGIVAYPIEKAYKKVLANILFEDKAVTVKDIPGGTEWPPSIQDLTLEQLLEADEAYLNGGYVYDLIDLFLASAGEHDPPYNEFTFSHIMRQELLAPLGMDHSGYFDTPEVLESEQTDMTSNPKPDSEDAAKSAPPPRESVILRGAGAGRTNLEDGSKLAYALADPQGLKDQSGKLLLSNEDLGHLFSTYGHYPGWGLGAEVEFEGEFVEKGGRYNNDSYQFWVDRRLGVGMIAMSNYGDISKEKIFIDFKKSIQNISHPNEQTEVFEDEVQKLLDVPASEYVQHPMQSCIEYFEGTRGKVGLEFQWDHEESGVLNWSGTPLTVQKQAENSYVITTPGRFEGKKVWKVSGNQTGRDYLAIGNTAFIKTDTIKLPTEKELKQAQEIFPELEGDYRNLDHTEWGDFHFSIEDIDGTLLLKALTFEPNSPPTPLHVVSVEPDKIELTGCDREPPDKLFRFYYEDGQWKLMVTDLVSNDLDLDSRINLKNI